MSGKHRGCCIKENESFQPGICSPSPKAARGRSRFCNLQKERLCGKICQIWAWLSLPRPMILKRCYRAEEVITPTPVTPSSQNSFQDPHQLNTIQSQRAWESLEGVRTSQPPGAQSRNEERKEYISRVKWRLFGLDTKEGSFKKKKKEKNPQIIIITICWYYMIKMITWDLCQSTVHILAHVIEMFCKFSWLSHHLFSSWLFLPWSSLEPLTHGTTIYQTETIATNQTQASHI